MQQFSFRNSPKFQEYGYLFSDVLECGVPSWVAGVYRLVHDQTTQHDQSAGPVSRRQNKRCLCCLLDIGMLNIDHVELSGHA